MRRAVRRGSCYLTLRQRAEMSPAFRGPRPGLDDGVGHLGRAFRCSKVASHLGIVAHGRHCMLHGPRPRHLRPN